MRQFLIAMLVTLALFAPSCYSDRGLPTDQTTALQFRELIEKDPYNPNLYAEYAAFLRRTGNFARLSAEMKDYAYALAMSSPRNSLPALSEILVQLGEHALAIEALQNAFEIMPHRGDIALRLGKLYESTGKYSLAKKEYERAQALAEGGARGALSRLAFLRTSRQVALIGGITGLILFGVSLSIVLSRMREKKNLIEAMRKMERDYESNFSETFPFQLNPPSTDQSPSLTPILVEQKGETIVYDFVPLPEKAAEVSTGVFLTFLLSVASLIPIYGIPFGFAALLIAPSLARRFSAHTERIASAKLILTALFLSALGFLSSSLIGYAFLKEAGVSPARDYYIVAQNTSSVFIIVVLVAALLLAMAAHEAGHALTAFWCGDVTAKRRGRLTLNPLKHIDLFGTLILPILLLLVTRGRAAFGYAKPVPIDPRRFGRRRRDEVITASAGSIVNLTLALASLSILIILGITLSLSVAPLRISGFTDFLLPTVIQSPGGSVLAVMVQLLKSLVLVNLFLGLLNLIPIPPLDGSYLLENAFPVRYKVFFQALRQLGFLILLVLVLAGALTAVFVPLSHLAGELFSFLFRLTRIF